jgi:hypothetical protein
VLHTGRWPLIILLLALGAAAGWAAAGLTTPEDNDVLLLGKDDPLERFDSLQRTAFLDSTEGQLWVSVVFGLQAGDDGVHTNPAKRPDLKLDPGFDPSSAEAQTWFVNFCRDTGLRSTEGECPVHSWSEWVTQTTGLWTNWTACHATASHPSNNNSASNCDQRFNNVGGGGGGGGNVSPQDFEAACGVSGFPVPAGKMERCMFRWANGRKGKLRSFYYPAGAAATEENAR